jgi:membrane associated rhomboid family serine protease
MFLPYADVPNPRPFQAWVTWGLIAINVVVHVLLMPLAAQPVDPGDPRVLELLRGMPFDHALAAMQSLTEHDLFLLRHGFRSAHPSIVALFTSMFLHGGLLHLAGNMLFLWIYGDNVEHRFGRWRFLGCYLACGVLATVVFAVMAPPSDQPMVGASGAISGVLGCYFVLFPRNRVRVLVMLFPFLMRAIELPARWVLGAFVVLDNLLPVLLRAGGNVAHGAHLGGFVGGLAIGWLVERGVLAAHRPVDGAPSSRARSHLEIAQRYLAAGHAPYAAQHFWRAAQLDPDGPAGREALDWLRRLR